MKRNIFVRKHLPSDKTMFRYRLNEHADQDEKMLDKIKITRTGWLVSREKVPELHKHLRTKDNTQGIIDMEEFLPAQQNEVVLSSKALFEAEPAIYHRDELSVMTRTELIEIGQQWNIDPVRKKANILAQRIIDKQNEFRSNIRDLSTNESNAENPSQVAG